MCGDVSQSCHSRSQSFHIISSVHLILPSHSPRKRHCEALGQWSPRSSRCTIIRRCTGGSYLGGGSTQANTGYQPIPSSGYITKYHALELLYLIRQQDRMAVTKMIQQLGGGKSGARTTLRNPMALCMLIQYVAKVIEDYPKYVVQLNRSLIPDRLFSVQQQTIDLWKVGCDIKVTWSTLRPHELFVRWNMLCPRSLQDQYLVCNSLEFFSNECSWCI